MKAGDTKLVAHPLAEIHHLSHLDAAEDTVSSAARTRRWRVAFGVWVGIVALTALATWWAVRGTLDLAVVYPMIALLGLTGGITAAVLVAGITAPYPRRSLIGAWWATTLLSWLFYAVSWPFIAMSASFADPFWPQVWLGIGVGMVVLAAISACCVGVSHILGRRWPARIATMAVVLAIVGGSSLVYTLGGAIAGPMEVPVGRLVPRDTTTIGPDDHRQVYYGDTGTACVMETTMVTTRRETVADYALIANPYAVVSDAGFIFRDMAAVDGRLVDISSESDAPRAIDDVACYGARDQVNVFTHGSRYRTTGLWVPGLITMSIAGALTLAAGAFIGRRGPLFYRLEVPQDYPAHPSDAVEQSATAE